MGYISGGFSSLKVEGHISGGISSLMVGLRVTLVVASPVSWWRGHISGGISSLMVEGSH